MLSYQHIYHAGNFADIHKHIILSEILSDLVKREKNVTFIDTHAGRGLYKLDSKEAQKTGEFRNGIEYALKDQIFPEKLTYIKLIKRISKKYGKNVYPGSPFIAKELLRESDDLFLMELHPKEHIYLQKNMKAKHIQIKKCDGYKETLSISPGKFRKGIVLIDPSYEVKSEYDLILKFISKLKLKWPEVTIMLWYPILKEGYHQNMTRKLLSSNLGNIFHHEIKIHYPDPANKKSMLGSGVFATNTSPSLQEECKNIFRDCKISQKTKGF